MTEDLEVGAHRGKWPSQLVAVKIRIRVQVSSARSFPLLRVGGSVGSFCSAGVLLDGGGLRCSVGGADEDGDVEGIR